MEKYKRKIVRNKEKLRNYKKEKKKLKIDFYCLMYQRFELQNNCRLIRIQSQYFNNYNLLIIHTLKIGKVYLSLIFVF